MAIITNVSTQKQKNVIIFFWMVNMLLVLVKTY